MLAPSKIIVGGGGPWIHYQGKQLGDPQAARAVLLITKHTDVEINITKHALNLLQN